MKLLPGKRGRCHSSSLERRGPATRARRGEKSFSIYGRRKAEKGEKKGRAERGRKGEGGRGHLFFIAQKGGREKKSGRPGGKKKKGREKLEIDIVGGFTGREKKEKPRSKSGARRKGKKRKAGDFPVH